MTCALSNGTKIGPIGASDLTPQPAIYPILRYERVWLIVVYSMQGHVLQFH